MINHRFSNAIFLSFLALIACTPDSNTSQKNTTEQVKPAQIQVLPAVDKIDQGELQNLKNRIRREKFDTVLPQVMRENDVDMWIYVVRESIPDNLGFEDFGSDNGVFIFTDRGGDRIERAVLGRRFKGEEFVPGLGEDVDLLAESGAYDIIPEAIDRAETAGGPETEYDYRFKGIGEFVAERDPKRIALNYMEKLGPHVGGRSKDGISHTDFLLLSKELGPQYAERLVSGEVLLHNYVSRTTKSEHEMFIKIREYARQVQARDWARIVPGVTKFSELESGLFVVTKDGQRYGFREEQYPPNPVSSADYVIQKGDMIFLRFGYFETEDELKEIFGNYYDGVGEIGYVLREGETEAPAYIRDSWAVIQQIHDLAESSIETGGTGTEAYDRMKNGLREVGFYLNDGQTFVEEQADKIQINVDFHSSPQGDSTVFAAPRIGVYGPNWQHDMTLPVGYNFYFEYFVFFPMPQWENGNMLIQSHDGAILNEEGVEFLTPRPLDIRLIK